MAVSELLIFILQVHIAGMMTDLPCHVSSEEEVRGLIAVMKELMKCCAACEMVPSMITIARYQVIVEANHSQHLKSIQR